MKILVIDDDPKNRQSALDDLKAHQITTASTFIEAIERMSPMIQGVISEINRETGSNLLDTTVTIATAEKATTCKQDNNFDVVLTDAELPYSDNITQKMLHGFVIALRATQIGAKYVALVTNENHHGKTGLSSLADGDGKYETLIEKHFIINGVKVVFVNTPLRQDGAKDWARVLKDLIIS